MSKLLTTKMCILLVLASTALWAQSVGGTLSGKVTSAKGPVRNAAVTITNVQTKASAKTVTAPNGTFSFAGLPPGIYNIEVDSQGFKHTTQQNIELTATKPQMINITLTAGNINETVELRGTTPMTQTDNGEIAVELGTRPVRELPVIDRNHLFLVGLQSGITPPVPALEFPIDPDRNPFYSNNGQSPFLNWYHIEGVINQEPFRGTPVRVMPTEGVQQLNISTSNLTMSKGFTGAAYIMDNTRGGTNNWHGSLWEFWSGNPLRSKNFFDNFNTDEPRFTWNQFGVSVGGPIISDKTFFFGTYEGMYERGALTSISTVPTAAARTGDFSAIPGLTLFDPGTGNPDGTARAAFGGNVIPGGSINPTSAAITNFIPLPNQPGLVNNFMTNTPFQNTYQKFDARVDQHFNDTTSAFVRYGYTNAYGTENSPFGPVIGAGLSGRVVGQNAVISLTHAFNAKGSGPVVPRLITDITFGYNRYAQRLGSVGDQTPLANALGLPNLGNGLISVNIPGMPLLGAQSFVPARPVDNTFNWVWNWSYVKSKHSFKWGVDIRRIRSDGFRDTPFNPFGANGAAFFGPGPTLLNNGAPISQFGEFYNSYAAFLLGTPTQAGFTSNLLSPSIRQSQYGIWAGDNFHILRRLTIDAGVRYEVFRPLQASVNGGAQVYDPNNNTFNYLGLNGFTSNITITQTRNVAPRIGMAFNLNDITVIRGGYGIQYFQFPYFLSGFQVPVTGSVVGVQNTYTVAPLTTTFGPVATGILPPASPTTIADGNPAGSLPVSIVARNTPTPYVQTYSLQVQRDFLYGSMLSVGYIGNVDRHLPGIQQLNAALPGTGIPGLPFSNLGTGCPTPAASGTCQFGSVLGFNNHLNSSYNSLQVNWNKRMAKGIAFIASYTYSKALGYTNVNSFLLNPTNLRSNYGPLDFDRTHILSIGHLWELPFGRNGSTLMKTLLGGWQLNGILHWQTATPLTFTTDPLICNCPGNTVFGSATTSSGLVTGNWGGGQSI